MACANFFLCLYQQLLLQKITATTRITAATATTATAVEQQAWIIFKRFEIYDGSAKEVAGVGASKFFQEPEKRFGFESGLVLQLKLVC